MQWKLKRKDYITMICVIIGAFLSALNINTFVNAGGLFPGGFTGITVMIQRSFEKYAGLEISYALVNYLLNVIPVYIGFRVVGKKFTIYSCMMIVLTGFFVDIIPVMNLTEDILLIAIFGGILQGVATGIALKGNASSGGTDFIAMGISKKTNQPAWNYILGMNAVMLMIAGYLFGWDKALYSIIFQFCTTQVIGIIHKRYKKLTVFIITSHPERVIEEIHNTTHHGVTRIEGIGTYYGKPRTMLYTVLDSTDVKGLIQRIRALDSTSFVNVTKTEYVEGRFYQQPIE